MARQQNNLVMMETRGMFGRQVVFKVRAGKTYVSAPPQVDPLRVPTPPQQIARDKFARCTRYAKAAVLNAVLKQVYRAAAKPGQSAYNAAFADAWTGPEVLSVDAAKYHGELGDMVFVRAKDNVSVESVKVSIFNASDALSEEGFAVAEPDGLSWKYTVTQENASVPGTRMIATAVDLAGNEGSMTVGL